MLNKPESCLGCPMWGDGRGYVPDEWVPDSKVVILAQNPGVTEEREGRPMCGRTGELMDTSFIPLANLERGKNVSVANILKCRWIKDGKHVDLLPEGEEYDKAVEQCTREHLRIPDHCTHVVLQGNHALRFATGNASLKITQWRGHHILDHKLGGKRVYATEHLASVLRDPKLWWISELDWKKIDAWSQDLWPQPIPPYFVYDEHSYKEAGDWFTLALANAPYIAIDTEYTGGGHPSRPSRLSYVGIGYLSASGVHGIQADFTNLTQELKDFFSGKLYELIRSKPTVFQNFAADMPVLKQHCDIQYSDYLEIHDTMLSHAIQYCELPHSLEFQASIYGQYPKLKHLQYTNESLYNWGDVIETLSMREGHKRGFASDTQAKGIYDNQSRKLIPLLLESMEAGILVNKARVLQAKEEYEQKVKQALALAHVYLGWPINLGSDEQVKYYCYTERGYPVQEDSETGRPTVSQDAVATLRDLLGPEVKQKVDQEELTIERAIERIEQGGDPILEARTLYMEYQHVLDAYIYSMHKTVSRAETDTEKKRARERAKGTAWALDDVVDRIYPTFHIHAQKTGRWSTSDPPLAQLPKALRNIIIPDTGHVWFHWDWSGIELHFLEAHSDSDILKAAHNEGMDIHTWTTCVMFGYEFPPNLKDPHKSPDCVAWRLKYEWKGKDDPRRTFAKSARYEMNYGGTGNTAAEKAIRMGLSKDQVKVALGRLLTADVKYFTWRNKIEEIVRKTRVLRTFMGRPRRFLGVSKTSKKVPPKVVREALDYQMQGGVSDVFNTVAVQIHTLLKWLFVYGMHDSQTYSIKREELTQERVAQAKAIVQQTFRVEGKDKHFPADFGIIYHPGEAPLEGIAV